MLSRCIVSAIRSYIATQEQAFGGKAELTTSDPSGTESDEVESTGAPIHSFCAADVIDFMLERAKKYPIVMVMLLEVRYAEVLFMLHEAEKKADVDLYLTAHKYLLPLFASTHAIKYVHMLSGFLVDWHCMSTAEKCIFAKGLFTRKTKNGCNIFSDRYVELTRPTLTKVFTAHTNNPLLAPSHSCTIYRHVTQCIVLYIVHVIIFSIHFMQQGYRPHIL